MTHAREEAQDLRRAAAGVSAVLVGPVFLDVVLLHPPVVGGGKRLFEDGGERKALELVESKTFETGVLYLTYRPA